MDSRLPGFQGEYLWELEIAERQLLALAAAVPEERYGWQPAEGARSFSAVLVHIAAGNFVLLRLVGAQLEAEDLYGRLEGDRTAQFMAMIRKNTSLEQTVTRKEDVIEILRRSFDHVRRSFTQSSAEALEGIGDFFGERTTVRRVYLRMLTHTHEHMGQLIAYTRGNGIKVPWSNPLRSVS